MWKTLILAWPLLSATASQDLNRQLADLVYDPFVASEQADGGGDLLAHYAMTLVSGDDVFMEFKTGSWISCDPPGSGKPEPCGHAAWNSQIWNERRFRWEDGRLVEKWNFESDWKPPSISDWEPIFQAAVAGDFVYVPGAGGTVFKLDREDGSLVSRINPFSGIDPNTFVAGPLSVDSSGNIYYNALQLARPAALDPPGSWLVKIASDDTTALASYPSLTPGAPGATDSCGGQFNRLQLPWPPGASAKPLPIVCGSQRPGLNIAPAIAPDGTIYTVSRAHFSPRDSYLVAVNPDLTPKWIASLRDRLHDGCIVLLPPNGTPGGCSDGAATGVDPATNELPAGQVVDNSSSSPVIAPDGSIFYGAFTRYNYSRGHLFKFTPEGEFVGAYDFGWDSRPAFYEHDGTYSVIIKDNHYDSGSYCAAEQFCPMAPEGPYYITQLSADLKPEWSFASTNTQSCAVTADGTLECNADHPNGFEWCINQAAVDGNGVVYANSEDGNIYAIDQGGALKQRMFLNLAVGAAYTPVSIGPDGKIYAQNAGHLLVIGN